VLLSDIHYESIHTDGSGFKLQNKISPWLQSVLLSAL